MTTTITGLTNGVEYEFSVQAIYGAMLPGDLGPPSNTVSATPYGTMTAPAVTATPGNTEVALSWNVPDLGGRTFELLNILWYEQGGGFVGAHTIYDLNETTYTATGLTNGTTYEFKISVTVSGKSGPTGTASATPIISAGGVVGANLWLNASEGITKNGNSLTGWRDETATNQFSVIGAPQVQEQGLNFHPLIKFDNSESNNSLPGDYLQGNKQISVVDGFVVMQKAKTASGTIVGGKISGTTFGKAYFAGGSSASTMYSGTGLESQLVAISDSKLTSEFSIVNMDLSLTTDPGGTSRINGKAQSVYPGSEAVFNSLDFTPIIGGTNNLGGSNPKRGWKHFVGNVGEVILFSNALSEEDKLKIESYLAMKYGVTLDSSVQRYVNSSGVAVWNNTNYWNDVFGIGKDVGGNLDQSNSNSINTGSGNGIGQSGKGNVVINNPSSLADGDYLMIGNDGGDLQLEQSAIAGFGELIRRWKVKQTGDVGTVDLTMDLNGLSVSGTTTNDFKLLIDTDGDGNFGTGSPTIVVPNSFRGNVLAFTGVILPNDAVFTFAEKITNLATGGFIPNRIIVNPSFETGSIVPHADVAYPESQTGDNPQIDGWYSTHPTYNGAEGAIEHWRSGFTGVPAKDGDYFVELNVRESSRLYETVYLVNGETVDWSYSHRQRTSGAKEELVYAVYSQDGSSKILEVDRHEATDTGNWQDRQGTLTWNQPTGIYQIGFESTTAGGGGNFLDKVNIALKAFVEFSQDTIRLSEGGTIAPHFLANGQVQNASSLTISVDAGTAIEGIDYNFSSKTKNIAVGNYALADSIPLNFSIIDNDIPQNDRTIVLKIVSTSGDVDRKDANADGLYQQTLVIIIEDDDPCKDPGTSNSFSSCASTATDLDLQGLIGGSPDTGGTWADIDLSLIHI